MSLYGNVRPAKNWNETIATEMTTREMRAKAVNINRIIVMCNSRFDVG